jgi:hypothetical protein
MSDGRKGLDEIPYPDEAFNSWGASAVGVDPLLASFTSLPYQPVRPHVPFYRFLAYPDILDLRKAGYELDRFIPLFDQLEDVRYRDAVMISSALHYFDPSLGWSARRCAEIELEVWGLLTEHGVGEVPRLLRRFLGKAFPSDTISQLTVDLTQVFFWAALAELADDLIWKYPELAWKSEYLRFPLRLIS